MSEEENEKKAPTVTITLCIACPHCGKGIEAKHVRERTQKQVPAEYKTYDIVEKDDQTQLDLAGEAGPRVQNEQHLVGDKTPEKAAQTS